MAILQSTRISGFLSSAKATGKSILNVAGELVKEYIEFFVSGFAGHGWKIWEYKSGKYKLEIDTVFVRETMVVFEMLIQKIRAVKGALGITQACGKIKTAELDASGENWLITIEDEMSFVANDFIRCQNWKDNSLSGYWVQIHEIRKNDGIETIVVPVSEFFGTISFDNGMEAVLTSFEEMTTPQIGDEIVQFGNSTNPNRQSAIYLHADEGGQPAIDILFDIKSKSFAGCVKQRMGGDIPGAGGLKGFYVENGMIKGTDKTGHTVYCIHPDGTAEFGDGSAKFSTDKSGYIAGGAISWKWDDAKKKYVCTMGDVILQWDNLSDEAKENLKGKDGENGQDGKDGKDIVRLVIEFYLNGIQVQNIPCDIHSKPITGNNKLIAKLYRITGNTKEEVAANKWTATYYKAGVEEVIGQILPEISSSMKVELDTDFEYDSIGVQAYNGVISTLIASGSISKVMANVPDWLVGWDTNKVQIGSEYMISPKLFTGKNTGTAENPILTGIVQGEKCITIDGVERSGIFALVNNEIVFELDPLTQKYRFKGIVEADDGYFKGRIEANDGFFTGLMQSSFSGDRVVIDTKRSEKGLNLMTAKDDSVLDLVFLYNRVFTPYLETLTEGFLRMKSIKDSTKEIMSMSGLTSNSFSIYRANTTEKIIDINYDWSKDKTTLKVLGSDVEIYFGNLPINRDSAEIGQLYIDGEVLKQKK